MNALHNPARAQGESRAAYKIRRRQSAAVIAEHRQGRFAHISTEPAALPVIGVDSQVDEAVLRGYYKDLKVVTLKTGEQIRVGRTKGKTYRKYPAGRDRKEWRQMHRDNPQPRAT